MKENLKFDKLFIKLIKLRISNELDRTCMKERPIDESIWVGRCV